MSLFLSSWHDKLETFQMVKLPSVAWDPEWRDITSSASTRKPSLEPTASDLPAIRWADNSVNSTPSCLKYRQWLLFPSLTNMLKEGLMQNLTQWATPSWILSVSTALFFSVLCLRVCLFVYSSQCPLQVQQPSPIPKMLGVSQIWSLAILSHILPIKLYTYMFIYHLYWCLTISCWLSSDQTSLLSSMSVFSATH